MISLNYRDSRPIYEQVRDGLRQLILTGAIAPEERLPSVRELASSLAINPNTIQRAFRELEADGFIYTVPGKGAFASPDDRAAAKRSAELEEKLQALCLELHVLGYSEEMIQELIRKTFCGKEASGQ